MAAAYRRVAHTDRIRKALDRTSGGRAGGVGAGPGGTGKIPVSGTTGRYSPVARGILSAVGGGQRHPEPELISARCDTPVCRQTYDRKGARRAVPPGLWLAPPHRSGSARSRGRAQLAAAGLDAASVDDAGVSFAVGSAAFVPGAGRGQSHCRAARHTAVDS